MTAKSEISKAIEKAFGAAFLLTGSMEVAENAVLDGIATFEFGDIVDDVLLLETVRSAIRQQVDFPGRSEQAVSEFPLELRRLFLLAPISRDCFVLRVLLGIPRATCSAVLRLTIRENENALRAALQQLPLSEVTARFGANISICGTTTAEEH